MEYPKMVTITEAAKLSRELEIGISKHHIRQLCNEGVIPCCKIGVKTLLNWQGLMDYLSNPPQLEQVQQPMIRAISERFPA